MSRQGQEFRAYRDTTLPSDTDNASCTASFVKRKDRVMLPHDIGSLDIAAYNEQLI